MSSSENNVTQLLHSWRAGNKEALDELIPLIYEELRRIARGFMRRERVNHTLNATALVNEAWLNLVNVPNIDWQNRAHFFAISSRVMRQILIQHARESSAEKRGGNNEKIALEDALGISLPEKDIDLINLNDALKKFEEIDPHRSRIVELRYFGGLTIEETAEVLGESTRTVQRNWQLAKAWFHKELSKK
jgi:RNA polymerase sigma factor (TIGR02999 family)